MNEKREQLLREFDAIAGRPATPVVYWKWIERAAAVLSSDASAHLPSSDAVDPHVGPRERVLRAPETPKTLSLPGLQALIEQWRKASRERFDDAALIPWDHRHATAASVYEICADQLSALLVVQGGVQQDEKEGNTDARVDRSDAVQRQDLPRRATGDVPTATCDCGRPLARAMCVSCWEDEFSPIGWQPIKTAKDDPREPAIVVLCDDGWHRATFGKTASGGTWGWFDERGFLIRPTHWMPLPDPPSPATARPTGEHSAQITTSDDAPTRRCWICRGDQGGNADERKACAIHGDHAEIRRLHREVRALRDFIGRVRYEFTSDAEEAQALLATERTTDAVYAVVPGVGAHPEALRAPSPDSSTTSPTHGGTPQEDTVKKDAIDELLGALDSLYRYASDEECPNAESHKFSRPNRARLVIEVWLKTQPAAHGGTAPHPDMEELITVREGLRPLDCGALHCRYCAAKSPEWNHSEHCPYAESVRVVERARLILDRWQAQVTAEVIAMRKRPKGDDDVR